MVLRGTPRTSLPSMEHLHHHHLLPLLVALTLLPGPCLTSGSSIKLQEATDSSSIIHLPLDFSPESFDDRYEGCSRLMWESELETLNRSEFSSNAVYAQAWTVANAEWLARRHRLRSLLRPQEATALLAYTQHGPLFRAFNAAVRQAGRSRWDYLENFHFKTLHFLLSEALRLLHSAESAVSGCHQVYRGVQGIHFTARLHQHVRLGQFTSTSLREEGAEAFGRDTFFALRTCRGVPIREFSFYPGEEEVLVPPDEVFVVTEVKEGKIGAFIRLESWGANSTYNCQWLKERRCRSLPCDFNSGWSLRGDPSILWGVLVATTTTLVATKGP